MRSWARRKRAAETIFMALVTCMVFRIERIRRLRSWVLAIELFHGHPGRLELGLRRAQGLVHSLLDVVVERLSRRDVREQALVLDVDELVEIGLEIAHRPDVD